MLDKAKQVLATCETELRDLLAKAAAAGDYDAVVQITTWAKEVAAIAGHGPRQSLPKSAAPAVTTTKTKSRGRAKDYPKFLRRSDSLVKIGWSKRSREEYEHKAPWSAAKPIAKAVMRLGLSGRVFQVPELLPLTDSDQGVEVPDYQVYLMFAWLRTNQLIDQHGRQGYSVPKPATLESDMEAAWKALPTKRS